MDYRLLLRKSSGNDGEGIVKRIIDVGFFKNEELATILGTSKRTIERIAAENTESESDKAAGREEALSRSPLKHWSDEDFAEVIKECEKDTGFVSKASLRAQFKRKTVDISEEQLGKELKKRGYIYRKKRVVLQLTEAHKEQRMSWARSLIDSDIASWIFSDECYVHLFRNSNLSWCKEGINATIEEPINWKTSIMIWGGISIVFGKMLFIKKEKYQCPGLYQRHSPGLYWAFRWRLHLRSGWGNSPYCKADYGILQRKRGWCEDSIAEEPRSQSNWDDLGQFEEESGEKKAWQQSQTNCCHSGVMGRNFFWGSAKFHS
ncbi:unnamed protein product [Blepharisma stoltei]|uniref:Transposase Tc1-like domain-containing protein n=1 Tax=Blepharisma stoltei TaxID=1481888 RepID=A0AAU9IXI6_9CILI|nr:unnamed protein product [Blepharisma stoltei]